MKCYSNLEDYDNLENLVDSLQPDDKLLVVIGDMFAAVGMGQQAVEAYTKVTLKRSTWECFFILIQSFRATKLAVQLTPVSAWTNGIRLLSWLPNLTNQIRYSYQIKLKGYTPMEFWLIFLDLISSGKVCPTPSWRSQGPSSHWALSQGKPLFRGCKVVIWPGQRWNQKEIQSFEDKEVVCSGCSDGRGTSGTH